MRTSSLFVAAMVAVVGTGRLTRQPETPEPRAGAFMVYDEARGQTLLFGGWTRPTAGAGILYPDALWAWDGNLWKKLEPTAGSPRPRGRDAPVMAYDAARRRVVMFGGRGDGTGQAETWLTDVWEWDGARWYRVEATGLPRVLHAMATYDPTRQRVVVYGGGLLSANGGFAGFSRTLWEWDGAHWTARDTAGLPNHIPGAMSASHDGIHVLFGESAVNRDGPRVLSPTLTFSRSAWSPNASGPAFNNLQATAGVPDGTIYFYQSWESWLTSPILHVRDTSGQWRRVESSLNPGVRTTQALAWDSRRKRLVLFGGQTRDQQLLADTWEFDGPRWTKR